MSRYIDAYEAKRQIQKATEGEVDVMKVFLKAMYSIDKIQTADVRKNIKAQKVLAGGILDGTTHWYECSHCHGAVDILDAYCKHCGAALELENDL